MIEERNHDLAIQRYYEAFGVGCDFDDRRGTDDDKKRAIDWIINGLIRNGNVQEKTHNFDFLGFLTGTFDVGDYERCEAKYLTTIYVNEDATAVEAFMLFDVEMYKYVCLNFPFMDGKGNTLIEQSGKFKGKIKVAHPFVKGASLSTRKGPQRPFIAIPLAYWLDHPPMQGALLHLWLSERAQRILPFQRAFYKNMNTPRCEDMFKWGIINV